MSGGVRVEVVDGRARYDGRTLAEWVPEIVSRIVDYSDPLRVVLFGSVARGEESPDSDIDLLVVLREARPEGRHELAAKLRGVAGVPVPIDIVLTDERELAERGDLPGLLRVALREGRVLHERAA